MSFLRTDIEIQEADVPYALDLLRRINELKPQGRKLDDYFREGNRSYFAFLQFYLYSQCRIFSQFKNYKKYADTKKAHYGWLSEVIIFSVHLLFLAVTALELLRISISPPRVVTFTSDFLDSQTQINPRLRNVHAYFKKHKISYTEVLHVTTLKNFIINCLRRHRPSVYYEALEFIARFRPLPYTYHKKLQELEDVKLDTFNNEEKPLVRSLLREAVKRFYVYQRLVSILRRFLRYSGVELYISVDDPRYLYELLAACREENIPTHVFQHSNYDYLTGLFTISPEQYIFPDHYYTWNRYWEKRVVEISSFFALHKAAIKIGGCSFANKTAKPQIRATNNFTGPNIKVLVPFEVSLRSDHIREYMKLFLSDGRIEVLFLLRGTVAQITRQMQIDKYFETELQNSPHLHVMEPEQRKEALEQSDVVAGVYSGFLDESIELGIPIAVFKTNFVNVNRLDKDDLASLIDLETGSIYKQLFRAAKTDQALLRERCRRVGEGEMDINETLRQILN